MTTVTSQNVILFVAEFPRGVIVTAALQSVVQRVNYFQMSWNEPMNIDGKVKKLQLIVVFLCMNTMVTISVTPMWGYKLLS